MSTGSFIEEAVQAHADAAPQGLNDNKPYIAQRILSYTDAPHITNAIAKLWHDLSQERTAARVKEEETGVPTPVRVKPEAMLSYLQKLMNKVCWQARSLHLALENDDTGNGIDFSQDTGERVGVYTEKHNIGPYVDEDFNYLTNVYNWMASKMAYLNDVDQLYYYASRVQNADTGEWEVLYKSMSFDNAYTAMEEVIAELEAKAEAEEAAEPYAMDFLSAA